MKIAILGAGKSGVGAALLGKQLKYEVFVSDMGKINDAFKTTLNENNIEFEEGKHTKEKIFDADLIIKSPGIPNKAPLIKAVHEKGMEVISEIEFASRHTDATIIAITGSNGKTTTTGLIFHILKEAGLDVKLGGNIGVSFAKLLTEKPAKIYVLEISSFQLDDIKKFKSEIALLLNITPDHLDRYNYDLDTYADSKLRIFENQNGTDLLIYNAEDAVIKRKLENRLLTQLTVPVSSRMHQNKKLVVNEQLVFDMKKSRLTGTHNMFNAYCAVRAVLRMGVDPDIIQQGLYTFENAPHRLEKVATIKGVTFINDSKATNVDSVYCALEAMDEKTVLVIGGVDKGNDYNEIMDLVRKKVKAMVCLGVDNEKLKNAFAHLNIPIKETQNTKEAVAYGWGFAKKGETVLLSPACASFDLFNNYEHRGDEFKKEVLALKNANNIGTEN